MKIAKYLEIRTLYVIIAAIQLNIKIGMTEEEHLPGNVQTTSF